MFILFQIRREGIIYGNVHACKYCSIYCHYCALFVGRILAYESTCFNFFVLTYRSYKHCIKKKKLKKIFFKFKVGVSLYCKKGKETIWSISLQQRTIIRISVITECCVGKSINIFLDGQNQLEDCAKYLKKSYS